MSSIIGSRDETDLICVQLLAMYYQQCKYCTLIVAKLLCALKLVKFSPPLTR